ncbi:MAG: methionyl-tRNA formyltransferase [Balneola sp.]|jgi:methionyl-tRNA formyltransferase|nr:methionyl-tRNA formyltransferase [Balneola sp.]MBE78470.1 methionyl-tRNA formyltransferase [Balneola sp.]HBX66119.1 methionyl-tRNA formyltransferase [Balneolaceae bacterium]|tara:strand:- start:35816 stop:36730 length:915 start_codon:yes stop_codon:yes gene_type:complete
MDIVFMGSPEFAIPSLEQIHQSEHTIKAVVSNVDKRRGRGSKTSPTLVKAKALELGLPVIEVENLSSAEFSEQLEALNADLFVVVAFRILPKSVLQIPKIGSINLHASLLPKYRGAAPIHWAIINGEDETGCTVFFLDEKVDTGNIIAQRKTAITENETTGELYNRLRDMGSELLLKSIHEIDSGSYTLSEQNDSKATPAPKLFRDDCHIDFTNSAQDVHNKIRGLSPFPTAWANWNGEKFNLYKSRLGRVANIDPGELLVNDDHLLVGCADGTVELMEVQLPGTKRLSAEELIRGYDVEGTLS